MKSRLVFLCYVWSRICFAVTNLQNCHLFLIYIPLVVCCIFLSYLSRWEAHNRFCLHPEKALRETASITINISNPSIQHGQHRQHYPHRIELGGQRRVLPVRIVEHSYLNPRGIIVIEELSANILSRVKMNADYDQESLRSSPDN